METNYYCVYIHTNKTNGKVYIGQTCQDINQRWRNGKGYVNNKLFYKAIQKYGWDNFEHKVIFTGLTKDEADKTEIELISFYASNNPDKGYNLTIGGDGTNGYRHTDEARNKISELQTGRILTETWKTHIGESLKGENAPWYNKSFSKEHRKHLSDAHIGQTPSMGFLGKKHSEETKKRMSNIKMGHGVSQETKNKIGIANSKKVKCIETGMVYSGLPEASLKTGCPKSGISMCCNGKQNSCKGYHWEYIN